MHVCVCVCEPLETYLYNFAFWVYRNNFIFILQHSRLTINIIPEVQYIHYSHQKLRTESFICRKCLRMPTYIWICFDGTLAYTLAEWHYSGTSARGPPPGAPPARRSSLWSRRSGAEPFPEAHCYTRTSKAAVCSTPPYSEGVFSP